MAYSDFTIDGLRERFGLQVAESPDLFAATEALQPSARLALVLADTLELARAMNTEKARSELLIAPVLAEVRLRFPNKCSLFSGVELNANAEDGLRGYCDFIVSTSPTQRALAAPVLIVVEAKNADLATGYGQCAAGMLGARVYNVSHRQAPDTTYGVVTTGTEWVFLRLQDQTITMDLKTYDLDDLPKILGILKSIIGA